MTPTLISFCCACAANGSATATIAAAANLHFIMAISSSPASVSGRLWFHAQEAAAALARGPGPVFEGEASALEEPFVDRACDAAERRHLLLGQPRLAPRVLERAAVQLDFQALGICAHHLGPEDFAPARDVGEERLAQPGQVRWRIFRKRRSRRSPAPVDRLRKKRFRPGGAKLL